MSPGTKSNEFMICLYEDRDTFSGDWCEKLRSGPQRGHFTEIVEVFLRFVKGYSREVARIIPAPAFRRNN